MVSMSIAEKAVKALWKDSLTVVERRKYTKPDHTTGFQEITAISDAPCKLSFESISAVGADEAANIAQSAKLICASGLEISEGSKIIISREGRTFEYVRSGMPAVYSVHQEIMLEPFERWA